MKYVGIYTQQSSNNIKSVLLLCCFPLLVVGMVWAFFTILCLLSMGRDEYGRPLPFEWDTANALTLEYLPVVLGVVAIWFIIAYFINDAVIRNATQAHPLERKDNMRVYNIVENLCIAGGMNMPKVYVVEDKQLNAYASGIDEKTYAVTVTRGLLNTLNDEELAGVYKVDKFVEKPCLEKAKEYLNSGRYLWNSGMFVWKVSTIMDNFQKYLPDMYEGYLKMKEAAFTATFRETLAECFENFKSESVDFGIMEKAENIYTLSGSFGWDDVGSWLALERINQTDECGNYVTGDVISIDTTKSIICGNKKLIATLGVEDLIVVDTDDAMLICAKDHTQQVKKVIETLRTCNRRDLI